jgi:hypothetical protein
MSSHQQPQEPTIVFYVAITASQAKHFAQLLNTLKNITFNSNPRIIKYYEVTHDPHPDPQLAQQQDQALEELLPLLREQHLTPDPEFNKLL